VTLVRDVVVSQLRQGGEQAASGGLARGEEGLGLLEELDPLELVVAAGAAAARGGSPPWRGIGRGCARRATTTAWNRSIDPRSLILSAIASRRNEEMQQRCKYFDGGFPTRGGDSIKSKAPIYYSTLTRNLSR
jgi:hypothetical protein